MIKLKNLARLHALALATLVVSSAQSADAQGLPGLSPTTTRASGASSEHVPVIYVHGIGADLFDLWQPARTYLLEHGYTKGDITDFHYTSLDGAAPAAEKLAQEVDWLIAKTGKAKVAIVSHSFGSLVTKLCVVEGGCKGKVSHWSSLAGANNGTNLRLGFGSKAEVDLVVDGPLITRIAASAAEQIAAQGVKVQVQWSPTDQAVVPPTLSKETWAENVELPGSVTHQTILWEAAVIARTHAFLQTP
ncbi:MAG: hypothetical protein ABW252_18420 [Polyangiales bacterium]